MLGRFLAASRARLREVAAQSGVRRLVNLAGCPAGQSRAWGHRRIRVDHLHPALRVRLSAPCSGHEPPLWGRNDGPMSAREVKHHTARETTTKCEFRARGDDVEERIVVGRSSIVVITLRVMSRHAEREANSVFEARSQAFLQREANSVFEARSQAFLQPCTAVEDQDAERVDLGVVDWMGRFPGRFPDIHFEGDSQTSICAVRLSYSRPDPESMGVCAPIFAVRAVGGGVRAFVASSRPWIVSRSRSNATRDGLRRVPLNLRGEPSPLEAAAQPVGVLQAAHR
jgi:hypothetical protein